MKPSPHLLPRAALPPSVPLQARPPGPILGNHKPGFCHHRSACASETITQMAPCRTRFLSGVSRLWRTPSTPADCGVHTGFPTAERAAVRALSSCGWAHGCLQFGASSVKVPQCLCTSRCGRVPSVPRQSPAVQCLGQWGCVLTF